MKKLLIITSLLLITVLSCSERKGEALDFQLENEQEIKELIDDYNKRSIGGLTIKLKESTTDRTLLEKVEYESIEDFRKYLEDKLKKDSLRSKELGINFQEIDKLILDHKKLEENNKGN